MPHLKKLIGQTEFIDFPELKHNKVLSRVDTGAQTSAIWASNIKLTEGVLSYKLFAESSEYHSGIVITTKSFAIRKIISSNGTKEERYAVKLLIKIGNRRIRATFTLANRSSQKYPVLVGRNILRGKFLVDVEHSHEIMKMKKQSKLPS